MPNEASDPARKWKPPSWFRQHGAAAFDRIIGGKLPSPPVLYHYTNGDGLLGIAGKGSIYATNIRYLNDSLEMEHPLGLAHRVLEARTAKEQNAGVKKALPVLAKALTAAGSSDTYVVSFSARGDQLSQWRGYCPSSAGFAIGFETASLSPATKNQSFTPMPCIYSEKLQIELLEAILEDAVERIQTHVPAGPANELSARLTEIVVEFYAQFVILAPALKHASFEEEQEFRLASSLIDDADPRICFRSGRHTLIPYFPFQLRVDDSSVRIDEVVVGPTSVPELGRVATQAFGKLAKIKFDKVRNSIIPYREL